MRKSIATLAATALLVLSGATGATAGIIGDHKSCGMVQTIVLHGEQTNPNDWMDGKVNGARTIYHQGYTQTRDSNVHSGNWIIQSPTLKLGSSWAYCSISINSHDS